MLRPNCNQSFSFSAKILSVAMALFLAKRAVLINRINKRCITTHQSIYSRWYSSHEPRLSRSWPNALAIWGLGGVLTVTGGLYLYSKSSVGDTTPAVPIIKSVASEGDIPVVSPVTILDLQSANRKLREQAQSFIFDSGNEGKGRLDIIRVPSNNPVEDEWSIGIGRGLHGEKTLFAGIFDGHA